MQPRNQYIQKLAVVDEALRNLGFEDKTEFSPAEIQQIQHVLDNFAILNDCEIEDFIGENPTGDKLEPLTDLRGAQRDAATARNLLRYIIRGVAVCQKDHEDYSESPLYQGDVLASLLKKRDPALFGPTRNELQIALNNIFKKLNSGTLSADQEKRYEKFLKIVLSIYPFIDPEDNQTVDLPVKIKGSWKLCKYKFEKLDISPKTGPLAAVLEDKDRIYAYGLTSETPGADPLLVFMGTTYPAGQGAELADLYNKCPTYSVGEAHDMTDVRNWLAAKKNVTAVGHSKGATMSMNAAVIFPQVTRADCFNPAPFASATLKRLAPLWKTKRDSTDIFVYSQKRDPVSYIGRGFLEGTHIERIIPEFPDTAVNFAVKFNLFWCIPITIKIPAFLKPILIGYERHLHYILGREHAVVVKGSVKQLNSSLVREFVDDVKSVLDWLLFPFQYASFFMEIILRKPIAFYNEHKNAFRLAFALITLATLVTLSLLGVFVPPLGALAALVGITLSAGNLTLISLGLSTLAAIVAPFVLENIKPLIGLALSVAHGAVVFVVGVLTAAVCGIKAKIKSLARSDETPANMTSSHRYLKEKMPAEATDQSDVPLLSGVSREIAETIDGEITPKAELIQKLNFAMMFAPVRAAEETASLITIPSSAPKLGGVEEV